MCCTHLELEWPFHEGTDEDLIHWPDCFLEAQLKILFLWNYGFGVWNGGRGTNIQPTAVWFIPCEPFLFILAFFLSSSGSSLHLPRVKPSRKELTLLMNTYSTLAVIGSDYVMYPSVQWSLLSETFWVLLGQSGKHLQPWSQLSYTQINWL